MTRRYRVKQVDTEEFHPQYLWLGLIWCTFKYMDCGYGGCITIPVEFKTAEEAKTFIAARAAAKAKEKEDRRRRREDYPRYFDWP